MNKKELKELRVYIADLADYNNGTLRGNWYDLNDYDEADDLKLEISNFLKETGHEEYAIHDYEGFPDCLNLSEYEDIETLFKIRDLYYNGDYEPDVVDAAINVTYGNIDDVPNMLEEYRGYYSDLEEFAMDTCFELGDIKPNLPDYIVIDWEATGQNLLQDFEEWNGHYFWAN